jgi:hypothetical protein
MQGRLLLVLSKQSTDGHSRVSIHWRPDGQLYQLGSCGMWSQANNYLSMDWRESPMRMRESLSRGW